MMSKVNEVTFLNDAVKLYTLYKQKVDSAFVDAKEINKNSKSGTISTIPIDYKIPKEVFDILQTPLETLTPAQMEHACVHANSIVDVTKVYKCVYLATLQHIKLAKAARRIPLTWQFPSEMVFEFGFANEYWAHN